jgi:hypothetical protein
LQKYPHIPQFRLSLLPGSSLRHGEVIDLLFSANQQISASSITISLFFAPGAWDTRLDDHTALAYLTAISIPKPA